MHEILTNIAVMPAATVFIIARDGVRRRISFAGHAWLVYTALVIAAAVVWLG
jgi:hypothetical protein